MQLKKLTILALFVTLSLAIYGIESAIPPLVPIPGIKPGLSNIITLILLCRFSAKDTALVVCTRVLLSAMLFGQFISLIYSISGAAFSFAAMLALCRFCKKHFLILMGITGGICHNLGQLLAAYLITRVPGILLYLPFLILAGMIAGCFTGLCARFAEKYLLPLIRLV